MPMIIGDINLIADGITREYNNFRQLYGSQVNALWLANFNKEDIANKSDIHFTILQYQDAFKLAHIIKEEYLLGINNTTISGVDIDLLRTKLRNNNIDLDAIFKAINLTEKVYSLEVVDDEVEETVLAREIDSDISGISDFTVGTEDYLDVIYGTSVGSAYYLDVNSDLSLVGNKDINISLRVIGKADDDIITSYQYSDGQIYLERDGTSLKVIVANKSNVKTYTIEGTYATASWVYILVNIKIASNTVEVVSFVNGKFHDDSLAETVSSFSIPITNRYVINANSTNNNRYHKISWYRGQFAKQDIFKEYLYYKNLITI